MSEITWLLEGLAFVLLVLSIYLHFWGIKIMKKYSIAGDRWISVTTDLDNIVEIYRPSIEKWKTDIDGYMEMPPAEHLFHAFFNTMVSLGAKDMGKEGQAKQNMAINGFQKIGRAIGKGLKKEIPAIEQFSSMGGGGDGGPGLEGIVGSMFGIDLPPGTIQALQGMGGSKQAGSTQDKTKSW